MTILLVRHAQSEGNVSSDVLATSPDHVTKLTELGRQQAHDLGLFLKDYYHANPPKNKVRLWCSPYARTTETLLGMREAMGEWAWNKCSRGQDIQFDERLREREWGFFQHADYKNGGKIEENHAPQYHYFKRTIAQPMGWYYVRPYGGESVVDIIARMRGLFADLHFDIENGVTDHLIVTHAMATLAFIYGFTKAHPSHFDKEILGGNTAVRLLDKDPATGKYADYGAIYDPEKNICILTPPKQPILRHFGGDTSS